MLSSYLDILLCYFRLSQKATRVVLCDVFISDLYQIRYQITESDLIYASWYKHITQHHPNLLWKREATVEICQGMKLTSEIMMCLL